MRKDRKAQLVTVTILFVVSGIGLVKKGGWRMPEARASQDPQDAVFEMLNATRAGDVNAYLATFSGQMEASLRQTIAETTESGFAKYLRDSNAAIKGIAVSDPQKLSDLEAKARVEYIYQDRTEAQTMYLTKGPNGWKISRADSDEPVKTLVPYGTPVR